jgi:hypothetical protein
MSLLVLFATPASVDVTGSATLVGVGVITASAAVGQQASAPLVGVGALVAAATVTRPPRPPLDPRVLRQVQETLRLQLEKIKRREDESWQRRPAMSQTRYRR